MSKLEQIILIYRYGKANNIGFFRADSFGHAEKEAERLIDYNDKLIGIYSLDIFGGSISLIESGDSLSRRLSCSRND